MQFFGGQGQSPFCIKSQVFCLTAGNRTRVYDRNPFDGGFGGSQTAGFGEKHIGGSHKICDFFSVSQNLNAFLFAKFRKEDFLQVTVVSADYNNIFSGLSGTEQFGNKELNDVYKRQY